MLLTRFSNVLVGSLLLSTLLAGCSGGGGSSSGGGTTASNPVPTVSSLSPAKLLAGSAAQTVSITGTNFLSSSTVMLNSAAVTPTYVSATELTIPLTTANLTTAGELPVVITNPTPGGGASSAVNFEVDNPAPTVSSLSPAKLAVGSAAQTLTITGTGFVSTSTATLNSASVTATYVSATQLTIPLTTANLTTAGELALVITNPAPGGGASSAVNFEVDNTAPAIASLSPSTIAAGATPPTVTVTGSGFLASSTVTYNSVAHAATYVSATSNLGSIDGERHLYCRYLSSSRYEPGTWRRQ